MAKNLPRANPFEGMADQEHTHEHTPTRTPIPKFKETRNKRLQLTQFPSLVDALARYAEENDTSSNKVVEKLLTEFLVEQGYYHK